MKSRDINMLEGNILSSVIRYTIPVILASILQLLFNAADLVIVGQFCGGISVGAVSATGAITNLIVNLFVGLSVGVGVGVAHGLGAKQDEVVHRTVHTAFPVALICGAILTVIGATLTSPLLKMMNTPPDVLPLSVTYMRIYFYGITFTVVYNFAAAILRGAGNARDPLIYLAVAGVLNVILNLVFVVIFHMNVAGVALATVLSQGVSAFLVTRALMHRQDACRFDPRKMHIYSNQLRKIILIGVPSGVNGSLWSVSNVIIQSSYNSFNDAMLLAGNGAASNIEGIMGTVCGFSQTAVNFVGQNMGSGNFSRVRKVFYTCLCSVLVVGIAAGAVTYLAAPYLLKFYLPDSQEAIAFGLRRMAFICIPYFLCAIQDTVTGALRGMGAAIVPMLVSVIGICGMRIIWVYTVFQIPQYHVPECLYVSYPISWLLVFILEYIMFGVVFRRKQAQAQKLGDQIHGDV